MSKPIFIVGSPRAGTLLLSRIIGGHPAACLITEHTAKDRIIPEDRAGVLDESLWQFCFNYPPDSDQPHSSAEAVGHLRSVYLAIANGKRLVLKNPRNTLRIPILRELFPDAQFIYLVRNPWNVLQSMMITESQGFFLRNEKINSLPRERLVQAAASWAECIKAYIAHRDDSWITVRYEEIVAGKTELTNLLTKLGLADPAYLEKATKIARNRPTNFYYIKSRYAESENKALVDSLIEEGQKLFGYRDTIQSLPASKTDYYLRELRSRAYRTRRTWGIGGV